MTATGPVKEVAGQKTWIEYGLADLRSLPTELRSPAPDEIPAADSADAAVEIVAGAFGLADPNIDRIAQLTPVGVVTVLRDKLVHIVEKRQDARERYANHAISTLNEPPQHQEAQHRWPGRNLPTHHSPTQCHSAEP